jgi:TetR/AcrR family transcriptional regulator, transcriptional repressor for nem operon
MTAPVLAATTRDALLDAAAVLLQDVGWASFSFRDLAEQVGIRAPSIHYHFPTKADLGIALVGRMREQRQTHVDQLSLLFPNPRERLLALGRMVEDEICRGQKSCPIYAFQAEFTILPGAVQILVRAWIDDCFAVLARWLEEGRTSGALRFHGPAEQQALVVWAVLQQGTQLHRTHPDMSYGMLISQLVATMSPDSPHSGPTP